MQVAGQKAQLFACFYRRAGQNNAADILGFKSLYRHGDRQVGFAGTRRPYAEGNGVAADGGQVFLLPQGLGVDGAALGGDSNEIVGQFPQALFLAPAGQADAVAHGLFFQRGVIFHQGNHAVHRVSGGINVRFGTGEPQHRATAHSGYVKLLL